MATVKGYAPPRGGREGLSAHKKRLAYPRAESRPAAGPLFSGDVERDEARARSERALCLTVTTRPVPPNVLVLSNGTVVGIMFAAAGLQAVRSAQLTVTVSPTGKRVARHHLRGDVERVAGSRRVRRIVLDSARAGTTHAYGADGGLLLASEGSVLTLYLRSALGVLGAYR